jgi:3-deoxy-D-manno-octulosonic-acid transferase
MTPIGGQNLLEPAALGKPVVVGPHTFNFRDISRQLVENQGAIQAGDEQELEAALLRLFEQPELRDRMGRNALELVRKGQGAVQRTLARVSGLLSPTAG